jgi:aminoglycoside 3-N-acetyltransferase I
MLTLRSPFAVDIYDLAVREDQRRKGAARGLIQYLQKLAPDYGAWVIYVQADKGDEPAIKLYDALGTREDVFHFDIEPARPSIAKT